jgi:hypothetical protein
MSGTVYRAPRIFVALFYALLAAWTVALVPLALFKASAVSATLLMMIVFFTAYSWYWSLGIAYMISLKGDGSIQFVSARACIQAPAHEVAQVEGPRLPFRFGFVKFRLERGRAYAFFEENMVLQRILTDLRAANPHIRFKNLPRRLFQLG